MELIKVIFTSNIEIKNELLNNNKILEKYNTEKFTIYEWFREFYKDEEKIILVHFINFNDALKYVNENYDIFKIIIASIWNQIWNFDLNQWDVIIPNTFVNKSENEPIFLEYVVWENYDLTKFWLILSWLCLSWNNDNLDICDICENDIYDILSEIKTVDLLSKTTVLLWINWMDNKDVIINVSNVVELVL